MKTWNYRTYKGRRFYRLNHAKLSKSMFFLAYYRILHTAYLKRQRYCIAAVKRMFTETFGLEPDAWSVEYITDTEKCFVNDTITEALNKNGTIACPECLRQMLIEIGFDVYLIQTVGSEKKPDRKEFFRWLPMKKSRELKKNVKCFWKERLPKEKLLFNLYYQLEPFKKEILGTYRKILFVNDTFLTDTPEKDMVLAYIDSVLDIHPALEDSFAEDEAEEAETDSYGIEEEIIETGSDVVVMTADDGQVVSEEGCNTDAVIKVEPESNEKTELKLAFAPVTKPERNAVYKTELRSINNSTVIKKKKPVPAPQECRGFREKNKITKKKAVTCAVCVAAAGALLVPLVAYTVIKHKAA